MPVTAGSISGLAKKGQKPRPGRIRADRQKSTESVIHQGDRPVKGSNWQIYVVSNLD